MQVCVFSCLLHTDYHDSHSTSKVRTFLGSEVILAHAHSSKVRVRCCLGWSVWGERAKELGAPPNNSSAHGQCLLFAPGQAGRLTHFLGGGCGKVVRPNWPHLWVSVCMQGTWGLSAPAHPFFLLFAASKWMTWSQGKANPNPNLHGLVWLNFNFLTNLYFTDTLKKSVFELVWTP